MTPIRRRVLVGLSAVLILAALDAGIVLKARQDIAAAVSARGAALQRLVSQRVDQHDAHLTSVSALANVSDPPPAEALQQVIASITRFYPRIVAIDVLDLTKQPPAALLGAAVPAEVVAVHGRLADAPFLLVPREQGGVLHILKRSPTDGPARLAIMMSIDLARLIASDDAPAPTTRVSLLLDGRTLFSEGPDAGQRVLFDQPLASSTQPLRLVLAAETLPAIPWGWLLLATTLVALGALAVERLLDARSAAREAGLRALVASHDAKLAHASRVNAMGELASGIAHELTQPLTAILSHSQAGQRLAGRPEIDREAISTAFDATTRNAKRAGDILGRLRSWLTKGQPTIQQVDLSAVVADVVQLLGAEAAHAGIAIRIAPPPREPLVMADRVHMEQVVFNLVRNAMDALRDRGGGRAIDIRWGDEAGRVVLDIVDNGPGFTAEALGRVFEPFFTTRAEGMGLGLSLCTTLVERYGGTLGAGNGPAGGAVLHMRMPRARSGGQVDRVAAE
ncbi:MAG: two-component sensor histidine kinase [Phreatobacter sp.]|uniref:sensor histidine kinase n=1 Tax=Phreatobacter sp. TaxID=1966341 RepID=UPI001A36E679|nr:ATP-binding protein [Phreatobacter sp.]MBL8570273.1 two-component sensor histidine kinase [Phreatobacter sp.]